MRIGLDLRYVYPDHVHGIGRYSVELVRHLLPLVGGRHELVAFVRPGHAGPLFPGAGVREVTVAAAPVSLGTWFTLGRAVRAARLDLFHALFPVVPVGRVAPRLVVTAHDLQALRVTGFHGGRPWPLATALRLFYRLAYRHAFRAADRIVAGSAWTRDDVARTFRVPGERFRVVHEGLGDAFRMCPDVAGVAELRGRLGLGEPYVLHVGNFRPQKRIGALLETFAAYLAEAPAGAPRLLVVAGVQDRFFPEAVERARALGLGERVRFPGFVADEDLPALYAGASLYVTAATHEGFGFTPLEAMALGVRVAAARAGALPEVLGDAAELFDPDSPREGAYAMIRALARSDLPERGAERARRYGWESTARRTLDAYEELLTP